MHLTTTNPVSGVWCQNTGAGVIPAISFTRLSRRNARIPAHAMRIRAYVRIFAHAMRMRAYARIIAHAMRMRAYARISHMRCECSHMRAFPRMRCDAMRMRACDAMRMRASRGNLSVSGTVPKSSAGLDNISSKILKEISDIISYPLSIIINQSLCTRIFPSRFTIARGLPLIKKRRQ